MKITCPECGFSADVKDELIPEGGRSIGCPKCKKKFFVEKEAGFLLEDENNTKQTNHSSVPRTPQERMRQPIKETAPRQMVRPPNDEIMLKSKIAAGILGIFLGGIGVHRFYLGFIGIGIIQIVVTLFTCGVGSLWGFIEGILLLTGSMNRDFKGRPLRD